MEKEKLFKCYSIDKDLNSIYHFKVLFSLMEKSKNQQQMTEEMGISKQYINKIVNELISKDYIKVSKTLGKIKYLKINDNPKVQIIGQVRLF